MGGVVVVVVFQTNYHVTSTWVEVGLDWIELKLGWMLGWVVTTFKCRIPPVGAGLSLQTHYHSFPG